MNDKNDTQPSDTTTSPEDTAPTQIEKTLQPEPKRQKAARRGTPGAFGSCRNSPTALRAWADKTATRLLGHMMAGDRTKATKTMVTLDRVRPGFGLAVAKLLKAKLATA